MYYNRLIDKQLSELNYIDYIIPRLAVRQTEVTDKNIPAQYLYQERKGVGERPRWTIRTLMSEVRRLEGVAGRDHLIIRES